MALKGKRQQLFTNIDFRIEGGKDAERGTILVATATANVAGVPATGPNIVGVSGLATEDLDANLARPLGMMLGDIENYDETTGPQKWQRDVSPRGSQVALLVKGDVLTNLIPGGDAPAAGQIAYLAPSGWVSNAPHVAGSGIRVGHFLGGKDSDGYAPLHVDVTGGPRTV